MFPGTGTSESWNTSRGIGILAEHEEELACEKDAAFVHTRGGMFW